MASYSQRCACWHLCDEQLWRVPLHHRARAHPSLPSVCILAIDKLRTFILVDPWAGAGGGERCADKQVRKASSGWARDSRCSVLRAGVFSVHAFYASHNWGRARSLGAHFWCTQLDISLQLRYWRHLFYLFKNYRYCNRGDLVIILKIKIVKFITYLIGSILLSTFFCVLLFNHYLRLREKLDSTILPHLLELLFYWIIWITGN